MNASPSVDMPPMPLMEYADSKGISARQREKLARLGLGYSMGSETGRWRSAYSDELATPDSVRAAHGLGRSFRTSDRIDADSICNQIYRRSAVSDAAERMESLELFPVHPRPTLRQVMAQTPSWALMDPHARDALGNLIATSERCEACQGRGFTHRERVIPRPFTYWHQYNPYTTHACVPCNGVGFIRRAPCTSTQSEPGGLTPPCAPSTEGSACEPPRTTGAAPPSDSSSPS